MVQIRKTNIEIRWNRKEILDIYDENGYKQKQYPAKAALLKEKYYKFECIDVRDIEHLLRYMSSNEKQQEFSYCFDKKRVYNDCNYKMIHVMDDKMRLKNLQ